MYLISLIYEKSTPFQMDHVTYLQMNHATLLSPTNVSAVPSPLKRLKVSSPESPGEHVTMTRKP